MSYNNRFSRAQVQRAAQVVRADLDRLFPPVSHEQHTEPVSECLRCQDALQEARELLETL